MAASECCLLQVSPVTAYPPTHTHTGESPGSKSILAGKEGNSRTEQAKVQAELPLHHGQHVNQWRSKQAKQSNGVPVAEASGTWSLGQGWSYTQLWRKAEGAHSKPSTEQTEEAGQAHAQSLVQIFRRWLYVSASGEGRAPGSDYPVSAVSSAKLQTVTGFLLLVSGSYNKWRGLMMVVGPCLWFMSGIHGLNLKKKNTPTHLLGAV